MRFTTVAVAVGLAGGLVAGGRLANLGARRFRAWPLLAAGAALQLAPGPTWLALSYVSLLAFALANLHIVGMGVVTIGLALNALVVTVNDGMPVRREALEAALVVQPGELAVYEGKRHIEGPGDRVRFLGDIVPVRPLREVVSFGDLIMAVGLAAAVADLVRRPPPGRHTETAQLAEDSAGSRDR